MSLDVRADIVSNDVSQSVVPLLGVDMYSIFASIADQTAVNVRTVEGEWVLGVVQTIALKDFPTRTYTLIIDIGGPLRIVDVRFAC